MYLRSRQSRVIINQCLLLNRSGGCGSQSNSNSNCRQLFGNPPPMKPGTLSKNQDELDNNGNGGSQNQNLNDYYESASDLPYEAKVVIYGDELVSKSLAYHLADSLGSDVVVISGNGPQKVEGRGSKPKKFDRKSALNSFVVNHFIVSNPRSSLLIRHSTEMFDMTKCGALYLAQTDERVKSLKRMISISKLFIPKECGEIDLLSPEEIKRNFDYIDTDRLKCGIYVPFDGVVADKRAEEDKLERLARAKGVQFYDEFILNKININNDCISNIELIHPVTKEVARIRCEFFVNSANNFLSRNIGKCSVTKVRIPTMSCEHQILQTQPFSIESQSHNENQSHETILPIVNDFDNRFTVFQRPDRSFCLTGYEKVSRVVRHLFNVDQFRAKSRNSPMSFELPRIPERWDNFHNILEPTLNRIPALRNAPFKALHTCGENFAPDGRPLIGEVAEIKNYLLAAAVFPSLTGGTAKLLEDIILKKPNSFNHDFWSLDPKRFIPLHSNRIFLFDRLREIPAKQRYNINFPTPHNSYQTGHGLRRSPLYSRLKDAGAYFTQIMGYERPAVYLTEANTKPELYRKQALEDCGILVDRVLETPSFGKPHWFDAIISSKRIGIWVETAVCLLEICKRKCWVIHR